MIRRSLAFLKDVLSSKHALWLVPAVAAGVLAFGIDNGWMVDDYVHRAALTQHPELPTLHRSPASLFAFVDGDPERLRDIVAQGIWPWWSAPELRMAFWRPVSGWSHALDYRAWPESPRLMHLHSIAWHLLAVVLLLLLYRRLIPHRLAVAGLAGLLFAIDDSQAFPVLWLANRNSVLGVVFGIACLVAHDRWRRDGWKVGAVLSPLLLLTAVLANEGAVAIGGYLVAYAIFLDPAPWRQRLTALLPSAGVGLAWAIAYKLGGYGALGSGIYIEPLAEPMRFAAAVGERTPFLLWGQLGFPPPDIVNILPDATRWRAWGVVVVLLALLAWFLRPVLRREAVARYLGLGMLLALLPASSTFPSSRLMGFVGIGAAGLLALLIAELAATSSRSRRVMAVALVTVHLVLAPLLIHPAIGQMQQLDTTIGLSAASLAEHTANVPSDPPSDSEVIVVTTPSAFISLASTVVAAVNHDWKAPTTLVLSSSIYDTEITRADDSTLIVRPQGGFLRSPGSTAPTGVENASSVVDPRRTLLMLDHLFRDLERDRFNLGDRIALEGVTLEIHEVDDGRPLAVAFHFAEPLDSERWTWLAWRRGRYERFPLPEIGESVIWPGLYGS